MTVFKIGNGAVEMPPQGRTHATKPDALSSMPRSHIVEGEGSFL